MTPSLPPSHIYMNTSLCMNLIVKLTYWAVKAKKVLLVFVYIPLLCPNVRVYQLFNQATIEVLAVVLLKNSSLLECDTVPLGE